jgi:SanA protein
MRWPKFFGRKAVIGSALILTGLAALIGFANYRILTAHEHRLHHDVDAVPAHDVALVLGANATLRDGQPNAHFVSRMNAAASLYHAGKVRHLLVSGDNSRSTYDEPAMMKSALQSRGIPAAAITCDYAGLRTLDSVVRAQRVFALRDCVIVSQEYHNHRALEIAAAIGLRADAFCASGVSRRDSFSTRCREVLARTATVLDLYVWHRQPRFLGAVEPIRLASR